MRQTRGKRLTGDREEGEYGNGELAPILSGSADQKSPIKNKGVKLAEYASKGDESAKAV